MSVIVIKKYLILVTRHSNTHAVVTFCALSITKQDLIVEKNFLTHSTFIHPGNPSGSSGLSDK